MACVARVMVWAAIWWAASTLELPVCSHPRRPSASPPSIFHAAHFTLHCRLELIANSDPSKQRQLCPEAFDPRTELARGVEGPCILNGTGQIITPASLFYVEEVIKAVMGQHIQDFKGAIDGSEWPPGHMPFVLTMAGFRRLHNVQSLLEDAIFRNVPGDFIETGVWRGGLCLVAAAIFRAYGQFPQRKVWLADSFQGLPPPTWTVDRKHHKGSDNIWLLNQNSLEAVQESFRRYGFLSDNVRWLPGYFNETLPRARSQYTSFAVIRLDGDMFQSVYESFENLYPYLSPGGYAIIDDFFDWYGAWKATLTFMKEHRIAARLHPVFHGRGEAVRGAWFQKPY